MRLSLPVLFLLLTQSVHNDVRLIPWDIARLK